MANKKKLAEAKKNKNDEFYTTFETIESEMIYYKEKFKDKIILCNCDDPELFKNFVGSKTWLNMLEKAVLNKNKKLLFEANNYFKQRNINDFEEKSSQFWLYFHKMFKTFELKELIATHYDESGKRTYGMRYSGGNDLDIYDFEPIWFDESNGDFRSEECINLLKESDIVITNPPFSLFREYVTQLIKFKKEFLIIGNVNALTYKEIFPLVKNNKVWLGISTPKWFKLHPEYPNNAKIFKKTIDGQIQIALPSVKWFTNLDYKKRHEDFPLNFIYKGNEEKYPKYDHYNAININESKCIPMDYEGLMGVPITFLSKLNPNQFEIIDGLNRYSVINPEETKKNKKYLSMVNGKPLYFRLVIKKKGN